MVFSFSNIVVTASKESVEDSSITGNSYFLMLSNGFPESKKSFSKLLRHSFHASWGMFSLETCRDHILMQI